MFTALGAAALHLAVSQYEILSLQSQLHPSNLEILLKNGKGILEGNQNYSNQIMGKLNLLINTPTVGAWRRTTLAESPIFGCGEENHNEDTNDGHRVELGYK